MPMYWYVSKWCIITSTVCLAAQSVIGRGKEMLLIIIIIIINNLYVYSRPIPYYKEDYICI